MSENVKDALSYNGGKILAVRSIILPQSTRVCETDDGQTEFRQQSPPLDKINLWCGFMCDKIN